MRLPEAIGRVRMRRALLILAGVLALWAVLGFLVLPGFVRRTLERELREQLHRPVTLRALSLNPFALSATLENLDVKDRDGSSPFLSFERLYLNLKTVSLLRRAPVLSAVTLTKPSVTVVRKEDGTYNFQDLLDEAAKEKPSGKPVRFSVNNIRIERGSLDFDDRPMHTKHSVRDVTIGIPFLSNIPGQVEITTQPAFEARVNGAPFALEGQAKPFSPTRETTVELNFSDVDLPHYLSYLPPSIPWKLKSGRLDAKLTITFTQPPRGTPALLLSGTSALRNVAVEGAGRPLAACDRFETAVGSFDVFARKVRIRSMDLVRPELWVRRERTGAFNFETAPASAKGERPKRAAQSPKSEPKSPPMLVEVGAIGVEGGKIHYEDLSLQKPFQTVFADVAVKIQRFSTAPGNAAFLEASTKTDAGEALKNSGTVSLEPLILDGGLEIGGLKLKRYAPFYERLVKFDVDDGLLDLTTKYRFAAGPKGNTTLSGLAATLRSPRLRKRGERKPFFQAPAVSLAGTSLDFARRELAAGELSSARGFLAVLRDKEGNTDITNLMAESPPTPSSSPPAPSEPWTIALRRLALDRYTIRVEDHALDRLARYSLTNANLVLENFSTARSARAALALRFGINGRGVASAIGPVGIRPIYADLKANVKRLDLVPLEAYVLPNLRLSLARGTLSGSGRLGFGEDAGGKASIRFAGNVSIADALALDQATRLDFFKWDKFAAEGVRAGYNPTFLEMQHLGLSGVACDVVVEPDGTINLAKVVGKPLSTDQEEETPAQTAGAAPQPAVIAAPPAPAPAPDEKVPIHIATLTLEGGRIGLADHFIQPNYSATLGDLKGNMSGLSTDEGTVAQLDLRGRLATHSPLQITGRVNPLAATAFADVKASFRDIDLPPFTPYSGKYAGYAIARGTLTMEVAYKLQNRKLAAENKFLVDQFEFGQKVESKDATKLPVRLAVSLLKDRNGLIDLDLPIEGSLDDPKFRIGKVIWKVLGNLIAKAATAPFSLLGKLLGGHGEEMSSVEFADGRETLDEAATKKLDSLAKALNDRPALKLEATGRFSDRDAEGLRRLLLERKVKAQKLSDLARKGEAPAGVDAVVVSESEYPVYLAKAYKKEKFKKPRNVLGVAKTLPPDEMEKLMLANLAAGDSELRQLALDRAKVVKEYLTGAGKVDPGRVFVLEPASKPAEAAGKTRASRVDFTLK